MSKDSQVLKFISNKIPAYITTSDDINPNMKLNITDILSLDELGIQKLGLTNTQYKNAINQLKETIKAQGNLLKLYKIYLYDEKTICTSGNFEFYHEKSGMLKNFLNFKLIKIKDLFNNLQIEKIILATSDDKEIKVNLLELEYYAIVGNNEENIAEFDKMLVQNLSQTTGNATKNNNSIKNNSSKLQNRKNDNNRYNTISDSSLSRKIPTFNQKTGILSSQIKKQSHQMTNFHNKDLISQNLNKSLTSQKLINKNTKSKSNSNSNVSTKSSDLNSQVKIVQGVTSDKQINSIQSALTKGTTTKNEIDTKGNSKNKKTIINQHTEKKQKQKISIKTNSKLLSFIFILVILIGVYYYYLITILFIGSIDQDEELSGYYYIDPMYDFSKTTVDITNNYSNDADRQVYEAISIADFLQGAAYLEFYDLLDTKITSQKLVEIYKAYMVVAKARAFSVANYNYETKEIFIKSGDLNIPYCDPFNGCKKINDNGIVSYISNLYTSNINGTVVESYPIASDSVQNALFLAYSETMYQLLTPSSLNEEFTSYAQFTIPSYNSTIRQLIIDAGLSDSTYKNIISNIDQYDEYKVYDLKDYAWVYSLAGNKEWWWPIGSEEPSASGLYSGPPMSTHISSPFGKRTLNYNGETNFHEGIDISRKSGTKASDNIIIAIRSGTVVTALNTCKDNKGTNYSSGQCGSGNGNFVRLDHGDGYYSIYKHLTEGSIPVKVGDYVVQGQMIGRMGNSGRVIGSGHLHFGFMVGGWWNYVDPLLYVDPENPRPNVLNAEFTEGETNKQTICLSLKSSGFSNEAVAAVLINIEKTSGYNPQAKSSNNALNGLFGYTSSQLLKIKSYCGNEYNTLKCQLEYFVNDININYLVIKNTLQSSASYNDKIYDLCYNYLTLPSKQSECSVRSNTNTDTILTYVQNGCK